MMTKLLFGWIIPFKVRGLFILLMCTITIVHYSNYCEGWTTGSKSKVQISDGKLAQPWTQQRDSPMKVLRISTVESVPQYTDLNKKNKKLYQNFSLLWYLAEWENRPEADRYPVRMLDRPISLTTAEFNNCAESQHICYIWGRIQGCWVAFPPSWRWQFFLVIFYVLFLTCGVVMDLEM